MDTGAAVATTVQTMVGADTASLPVKLDGAERRLAETGTRGPPLDPDHNGPKKRG